MTVSIIGIVAALVSFGIFLLRRRITHVKTPAELLSVAHEQVSKEIIRDDAVGANKRLDNWLRELQSNKRGQSSSESEAKREI